MESAFMAELREFERRLGVNDDRLLQAERRARALKQNLRDAFAYGGLQAPLITAIIVGGTTSCGAQGLPGETAVLLDASSNVLGVSPVDAAGHHAFTITIPTDPFTVYLHGDPVVGDYARVLAGTSGPYSVHGGETPNAGVSLTLPPNVAAGYFCNARIGYPVRSTLTLADPRYGTGAIVSGSNGSPWNRNMGAVTFPPSPSCPGATGNLSMVFSWDSSNAVIGWNYPGAAAGSCPTTGGSFQSSSTTGIAPVFASVPGPNSLLDLSWTLPAGSPLANRFYGGTATTIRVFET